MKKGLIRTSEAPVIQGPFVVWVFRIDAETVCIPASSIEDCVRKWNDHRNKEGFGSRDLKKALITTADIPSRYIGIISYNGAMVNLI